MMKYEYEAKWSDGYYITRNGKAFITFADDVSSEEVLDVVQALNAAQQSVQRTGYQSALIPCPHCGVNITVDSDMLIASR